jgi:uncharacterized protein YbgA (DUF1722 family)
VEFHAAHELLLRSHTEAGVARLGRLVASAGRTPDAELFARYEAELQRTLRTPATVRRHASVLRQALGCLEGQLRPAEKRTLLAAIEDFRKGNRHLLFPVTLLRSDIRKHAVPQLEGQLYFDPYPDELMHSQER